MGYLVSPYFFPHISAGENKQYSGLSGNFQEAFDLSVIMLYNSIYLIKGVDGE